MSKEHFLKEFIRTKLSEAGMSSKFRKAVEEYKEVSLKLQDLFADRSKALEGYKKASGDEKEKYKAELSRIQKLVTPLQTQMEKAERVFNKALLSEPEELEEGNGDGLERVASGLPQTEEEPDGLEEKLNPEAGEWVLYKPMGAFKKKFVSIHKSHRSAQIAMKKALDKMNRSGEDGGYGIMSKDKWDKEDSRFKVESVSESTPSTIQKIFRKIGWAGEDWTPRDYAKQIKNLPDDTLKIWYNSAKDNKGIPNTPLNFQQKLTKIEMEKRGLLETVSEGKHDKEIKALEDKIKAVKGKTPADLGRKAAMQDDLERLKSMNEENINEASRRANEMFGETKFGQEIHKMLKGKWDAKKVEDYLDGQGGEDIKKHLRIIDFISRDAGLNPRKYDNQTLGKHISDLVDKLEVLYTDFTKGTDVKKFDDVHIKSKNLTGIVYAISGNTLIVKTASGMVKTTKDDVEVVMSDSVIKEGNAFGMAVTQAKKEGKKEFEFNGKTYKVKKGKGKVNESDCGCGSKVVVGEGQNETDALDKIAKFETYLRYIANDDKYKPLVSRVRNEIDRLKKDLKKNESVNEAVKEPEVIAKIRDIVKKHQHASVKDPKLGKMIKVDAFSASAIIQVYDAINDTNKEKFAAMSIPKMAEVAFKLVKK